MAAGSEFTVCVDAEDQVFAWGKADAGQVFQFVSVYKHRFSLPPLPIVRVGFAAKYILELMLDFAT